MAEKFAATLAILAFVTVVLSGVIQEKSVGLVLAEATGALVIVYMVGKICSLSARQVVRERFEAANNDETPAEDTDETDEAVTEENPQPVEDNAADTA